MISDLEKADVIMLLYKLMFSLEKIPSYFGNTFDSWKEKVISL